MNLAKKSTALFLMIVGAQLVTSAESELFWMNFDRPPPNGNGEGIYVHMREVERRESTSMVEVRHSFPLMVDQVLRGLCELAKMRKETYFRYLAVSDPPLRIEIRFYKSRPEELVESSLPGRGVTVAAQCPIYEHLLPKD